MNLNKMAATAAMAGALGSAALGIGAGLAQADPDGPGGPGPNVPGPNVPGGDRDDLPGPAQHVPAQPVCSPGAPGVNCNVPGSPLPPGQSGFPPPGQVRVPPADYNEPTRYGLPATWRYNDQELPLVYDPDRQAWGVNAANGFQVYTGPGGVGGQNDGQVGVQQGR